MVVRNRGHHHFDRITANQGLGGGGFDPTGIRNFQNYFVDPSYGSDSYSGKSWGKPKATLQAAVNLCTGRGLHRVHAAPGGYSESVETPLNAAGSFGQIIGYSPTSASWGAAYWGSGGVSEPCLTVRSRGWRVSGFELDSPTGAAAVLLQRNVGGTLRSSGFEIDHCFIGATITGLYGVEIEGADTYIYIHDNDFSLLQASGGAGIFCNTTPVALALMARILRNVFRENESHILCGASWGFNGAQIEENSFQGTYANGTAITKILDLRGGRDNEVHGNYFGIDNGNASGQYDSTTGPCLAGTGDSWAGNYINDGLTDKNPGSGS